MIINVLVRLFRSKDYVLNAVPTVWPELPCDATGPITMLIAVAPAVANGEMQNEVNRMCGLVIPQRVMSMDANQAYGPEKLMMEIRSLAGEHVERTSLRAVASQLGMSPSGLSKFLGGATPYQKTVGKLESWYLLQQDGEAHAAGPSAEVAAVAVRLLARVAPPSTRQGFLDELLAALRRVVPPDVPELQLRGYEAYLRDSPIADGSGH